MFIRLTHIIRDGPSPGEYPIWVNPDKIVIVKPDENNTIIEVECGTSLAKFWVKETPETISVIVACVEQSVVR